MVVVNDATNARDGKIFILIAEKHYRDSLFLSRRERDSVKLLIEEVAKVARVCCDFHRVTSFPRGSILYRMHRTVSRAAHAGYRFFFVSFSACQELKR